MALVLTEGPALEPVSVAEAKAHLRLDTSTEDLLVAALVTTARVHIETSHTLALITQSWSMFLDRWPEVGVVPVPIAPFISLVAVRAHTSGGLMLPLPADAVTVDPHSRPARLVRTASLMLPSDVRATNGIEINFRAGFGAAPADVPAPIRQAIVHLAAHWYEHRIPDGSEPPGLPPVVADLLAPWRPLRLV